MIVFHHLNLPEYFITDTRYLLTKYFIKAEQQNIWIKIPFSLTSYLLVPLLNPNNYFNKSYTFFFIRTSLNFSRFVFFTALCSNVKN